MQWVYCASPAWLFLLYYHTREFSCTYGIGKNTNSSIGVGNVS